MNFLNSNINPTTANYPGLSYSKSIAFAKRLNSNASHMQLCPQQTDFITEDFAHFIKNKYNIQFRCHANTKFYEKLFVFDASSDLSLNENIEYINKLHAINNIIDAPVYSYHAGKRNINLDKMKDNVLQLQDILKIPVAVEGLYPNEANSWLLNSWKEYEWLLNSDLNMAIDLSHIQIIAENENYINNDLIEALLTSDRCLEIHISTNDLKHDNHRIIKGDEFWIKNLNNHNLNAIIFSEENFNIRKKMEFNINLPENEKDIQNLSEEEKYDLLNNVASLNEQFKILVQSMVEDIIYLIIKDMPEINKVELDAAYEYNDEGYSASNVMTFFNDEWNTSEFYDLQQKFDDALSELGPFLSKDKSNPLVLDLDDLRYKKQNSVSHNKNKRNLL